MSKIETGQVSVNETNIKLICKTYNVNEEWLRTGKGEMFLETKESFLNDLAKQYSLDDFSIKIIEGFLELSPDKREVIKDYIFTIAQGYNQTDEKKQAEIDAEVEAYRKELESEKDYNGLMETLYLSSVPAMKEKIIEGLHTPLNECLPENEVW